MRKQERIERLPQNQQVSLELDYDQTPRADFAKVKEILRGYGTLYPQSQYVPESHYLLALTFEQLIRTRNLLKNSWFFFGRRTLIRNLILNLESTRAKGDRDYATINELKGIWNFWKKKTGNYLANKFLKTPSTSMRTESILHLQDIDPSPSWQVPVLYQVALCEEKLGNYVQANGNLFLD